LVRQDCSHRQMFWRANGTLRSRSRCLRRETTRVGGGSSHGAWRLGFRRYCFRLNCEGRETNEFSTGREKRLTCNRVALRAADVDAMQASVAARL
jgi:hypothetical protein